MSEEGSPSQSWDSDLIGVCTVAINCKVETLDELTHSFFLSLQLLARLKTLLVVSRSRQATVARQEAFQGDQRVPMTIS
jgi:hypothetical protein